MHLLLSYESPLFHSMKGLGALRAVTSSAENKGKGGDERGAFASSTTEFGSKTAGGVCGSTGELILEGMQFVAAPPTTAGPTVAAAAAAATGTTEQPQDQLLLLSVQVLTCLLTWLLKWLLTWLLTCDCCPLFLLSSPAMTKPRHTSL